MPAVRRILHIDMDAFYASVEQKKPDGLTVISPERVEPFLQKLPVDALCGVGPVTALPQFDLVAAAGLSLRTVLFGSSASRL